jgi:ABC-type transport system involved in multi-copper enzyme maturation permease subunit
MTILPVIARELRAAARQPFTYNLRVLGVTALLLASVLFGLQVGFRPAFGRELFAALHCALFGAIWLLVPMLTADCISRERREETLGLLFMTPLKGTDIVVAKGLAHGLRAVTLAVAVVPVLTIPFLLGGVSWTEALLALLINANAMCWALAAGLLASAWGKAWHRTLLVAAMLVVAFFLLLDLGAGWFLVQAARARRANWSGPTHWQEFLGIGFSLLTDERGCWAAYNPLVSFSQVAWAFANTTGLSLLGLAAALVAAGAKTRRSWQEEPPSRRQVWLRQTFCTPVLWLGLFRRWMRRKLERNPIGWLEQRTWSGRLVTWSWFAVLVSIYSLVLADRSLFQNSNPLHCMLGWLLAGSMALSAAGSFRRERETGVLELLLVSPLGEHQIIRGRLGGLWSQFAPAAGLLLAGWTYCSSFVPDGADSGAMSFFFVTFLTVPVFGLYYSLRCRNFLTAFLATIVTGLVVPVALPAALWVVLRWAGNVGPNPGLAWDMRPSFAGAICQGGLAVLCWGGLSRRLTQRAFPLERAPTY